MSKRVLVTGGAGFIGSAVVGLMQEKGFEVAIVDNLSFGNKDFIKIEDTHFFNIDILHKEAVRKAVSAFSPQWIIHLAAIHFIPYCNAHPFESANINIAGTQNILDIIEETEGVEQVFFASTAAVYPIIDGPIAETCSTGPMDIYGLSKLAGEKLLENFYHKTKIKTTICRFFNAFGPNETNPHLIPEIERQLKGGTRTIQLGNLTPKRDFIHTFDMANAVLALLQLPDARFDVFNLGRGVEYSVTEIVEAFERQLGEKIAVEVAPERVRKVERMHLLADVGKLKRTTGWEPQWSLDDGIRSLLNS